MLHRAKGSRRAKADGRGAIRMGRAQRTETICGLSALRDFTWVLLGRANHSVGYSSSCRCQVRAFAKKEAFALRSLATCSSTSDHFEKSR